jgi:hypothetical protein
MKWKVSVGVEKLREFRSLDNKDARALGLGAGVFTSSLEMNCFSIIS